MQPGNSVTYCEAADTFSMSYSDSQDSATDREAANLLNKMDNAGYERDHKSVVEMGDVTPSTPTMNGNTIAGCTDMCLALHQQHQKSLQEYHKSSKSAPPESPWHQLKTIFLVAIIAILVLWIIVYTILNQMDIL